MVSPSASAQNPRRANSTEQTLQRRLAAASASSAGITSSSSTSALPQQPSFHPSRTRTVSSSSSSVPASRSITPPTEQHKENVPTTASSLDPGTPRSRHRRAAAQAQLDLAPPPSAAQQPQPTSTLKPHTTSHPSRTLYEATYRLFESFLAANSPEELPRLREVETEQPKVFITSWVDYTHKYGTAYSLTDGTAGLYFNDSTTMVLSPDKE